MLTPSLELDFEEILDVGTEVGFGLLVLPTLIDGAEGDFDVETSLELLFDVVF